MSTSAIAKDNLTGHLFAALHFSQYSKLPSRQIDHVNSVTRPLNLSRPFMNQLRPLLPMQLVSDLSVD